MSPGEDHVSEIAAMSLDLLAGSVVFRVPNKPNKSINLRMGFHRYIHTMMKIMYC